MRGPHLILISLKRIIALPYMVQASEQLAQENLKPGQVPKGKTMEEPWSNYASLILKPWKPWSCASLILGLHGHKTLYYGMIL